MRYFIEVSYDGTNYGGSQIQENAKTIQSEVERALSIFYRTNFRLTGSSRTDAGVHALQNFFHLDSELVISNAAIYHLNSILPVDIAVQNISKVSPTAHCRFDAVSREYKYHIHTFKDPFLLGRAWYFPYKINHTLLKEAADILLTVSDFSMFSKRNSQVNNNVCNITHSSWHGENNVVTYSVKANRFLRGMVKALVATMLLAGRGKLSIQQFQDLCSGIGGLQADFSAPSHGLFLARVNYPPDLVSL